MRDAASVLPGHVLLQAVWAKPVLGQAVSRAPMGCSRPPRLPLVLLVLLVLAPAPAVAWDSVDLELFDLVEEVPQNFYAFLGVEQDASSADIRKAYRRLSLLLHPDKNKDENAETHFRQLVAIYEVLKDEERRQRYDSVLINGLPDWRQPVFYYRGVRKMSNAELALLLFIILTVGHYAVVWSIYLEKQLDELLSRRKRGKKKKLEGKNLDEMKLGVDKNERFLEKPQWRDLLPYKLGMWCCVTVKALPQLFQEARQLYVDYKETKTKEKEEALARAELETIQKEKKPKVKKPKPEFPAYIAAETNAYVPSYDPGVSIEEIEEQMDNWLEDRNKSLKRKSCHGTVRTENVHCLLLLTCDGPLSWEDIWVFHSERQKSAAHLFPTLQNPSYILDHLASPSFLDAMLGIFRCFREPVRQRIGQQFIARQAPEWTEEDVSQLTRSMVKFPGGTPGRWEKIAHELGRSVADVTMKAKQRKDFVTCVPGIGRHSELTTLAQNSKSIKGSVNLSDHIITQREREEEAEAEAEATAKPSFDPEPVEMVVVAAAADPPEAVLNETRYRKRKPPKATELPFAATKATAEDRCRGRRQKDFDSAGQEECSEEVKKKERSRSTVDLWTQTQQKLLEVALQQHPKGTAERWDKIAKDVPGKSKEECMARYKVLVELVQKKKMAQS